MAPKKNTNGKSASDTYSQDENNNNNNNNNYNKNNSSSQQRQNTDANNNNTNTNKEKSGSSQRIGGDGPRAKPVSRSKKAVSFIEILFNCWKWKECSGCDLSCSSNFTSFEKSKQRQTSAKCHCCLHGRCTRIFSKFDSANLSPLIDVNSGCRSC